MTTPTTPPDALSKLMAPISSPDLSQGLAAAAGALGFVQTANGPIPIVASLNSCIEQLAASIVRVNTFAGDDDQAAKQVLQVISKPFDELGSALAQLLLPDPNAVSTQDFGSFISDVGSQLADAIRNPFLSIINQQSAVLESSFDQIKSVLFADNTDGTNGFFVDYFNQAKTAVKTLFLSPTNTEGNLAGIFLYAFEHGIPAIQAELAYLKAMKSAYIGVLEETSKLPATLQLSLTNNSVIAKLCDAENSLQNVSDRLRTQAQFDRTQFQRATNDVCSAQDLIFDGKFDTDLLKTHSADFLGISDIKAKDLANLRFLPGVAFKLQLQSLTTLSNLYATQESAVTELYNNILEAESAIQSLVTFNSGDIIALLVDVLHRQIKALRLGLQTQGGGFDPTVLDAAQQTNLTSQITADGLSQADATTLAQNQYKGFSPYAPPASQLNTDVSTYLSSQAATYLMLVNLCTLMERAQMLYSGIDAVVGFESNLMKTLQKLIKLFAVENCGPPTTGVAVENAITNFLTAATQRLNSTGNGHCPSNEPLRRAGQQLDAAIKNREAFLACMMDNLSLGIGQLNTALALASSGYALFTNIKQMAQNFPDLQKEIQALNLRNLLGIDGQEYSALESLLQAVQCLLLNCNNPLVQSVGEDLLSTFQEQLDRRSSQTVTMSALDEVPTIAATARSNNRINQILRVISSIQSLLNLDFSQLCATQDPAQQVALNQQRTTASGAAFGSTPTTPIQPTNTPNSQANASTAVQQLAQSIVVNGPIYNAPTQSNPPAFSDANGATSFA